MWSERSLKRCYSQLSYYQLSLHCHSAYQEVGELEWELFPMNNNINLSACVAQM